MLRLIVVVELNEPEVPVIVSMYCPRLAVLLAVNVKVLAPVVGLGLKEAVTPLGSPDVTARLTLPVNPLCGVTQTVEVPEVPRPNDTL